ncbi:MAG TPA: hypothetical protein PK883_00170 [Anaerolineaceae bacterium]|nr:hypothetical protein [Anaerolineaceae bacterium]
MKDSPVVVKIALVFILINTFIFFVLGVLIAGGWHSGVPQDAALKWIMMLGMFAGAILLALCYLLLAKRRRLAFFITMVVLALIIALTIFDQVGWADLVMLLVAFIPFALLILGRKWFLQKKV